MRRSAEIDEEAAPNEKLRLFYFGMGMALRRLHEAGFIHRMPHHENFSVYLQRKNTSEVSIEYAVIHDLDQALRFSDLTKKQKEMYMFNDILCAMNWTRNSIQDAENFIVAQTYTSFIKQARVDGAWHIYNGYFSKPSADKDIFSSLQLGVIWNELTTQGEFPFAQALIYLETLVSLFNGRLLVIFNGKEKVLDELVKELEAENNPAEKVTVKEDAVNNMLIIGTSSPVREQIIEQIVLNIGAVPISFIFPIGEAFSQVGLAVFSLLTISVWPLRQFLIKESGCLRARWKALDWMWSLFYLSVAGGETNFATPTGRGWWGP